MDKKINLLNSQLVQQENNGRTPIKLKKKSSSIKIKPLGFILIFLLAVYSIFAFNESTNEQPTSWIDKIPIVSQIKHLVESAENKLDGEKEDRINILLLGIGGKNHDGGLLTDTIILASLKPSEKKLSLISIPRDLAVPVGNMGWRKINSINAYAEMENPNSGGTEVSKTISEVFQIPIHYYVTVDFTGFEKIIDDLGGIKIDVENTLDDYKYPILGNEDAPWDQRWEHLHIDKGLQNMNGELALKYVRSRHALGVEGSDFARSRRQQKVLEAVKEKLLSLNILFKPTTISRIISDISDNYQSNLKIWEIGKLWNLGKDIKSENIINRVLDNSLDGFLVDSVGLDGAYLLQPKNGNFSEIQYLVKNIFNQTSATDDDKEKIKLEKTTIEIRNGTWENGLANKAAEELKNYGFNIVRIGNTSQKDFEKTVIYDLTYGEKIQSLTILKNKTNANVALGMPQWLIDELSKEIAGETAPIQPDFILIIGKDADAIRSGIGTTTQ